MSDSKSLVIRNVQTPGGAGEDLLLEQGRISKIGAGLKAPEGATEEDGDGCLVLPGLVDGHTHLDKTLWGLDWHSHAAGPTVADRIQYERAVLTETGHDPAVRSRDLIRHMVARGTTHVRTHVDVVPSAGLDHVHGVLEMREQMSPYVDVQLVAFPQTGVMRAPGTAELLDEALQSGAEVLGGIDPIGIDKDPQGQLDVLFGLAEKHGCELDIHLHDQGEVGAISLELIAERVRALGLSGKVTISHGFCLGSVAPARFERLVELLCELDIALMSHGPSGGTPFPPLCRLDERGVRLFTGSDGIRDAWGPLNTGDMLERAFLVAYVNGFRDDAGLELCLDMATGRAAQALGLEDYGLTPGCKADLVLVEASNRAEAVIAHGVRKLVIKNGAVVARDNECLI